jgi:hypothetical protein
MLAADATTSAGDDRDATFAQTTHVSSLLKIPWDRRTGHGSAAAD